MTNNSRFIRATLLITLSTGFATSMSADDDWKDKTISPVANPLFFEAPQIQTEARPVFIQHNIDKSFITGGGDVRVYALQLRYAVSDRLAIIATKDGYIEFNPKSTLTHQDGWANIAAGIKYALVQDVENQFIFTPGVKLDLPTGNKAVFQGRGKGEWDLFVSALKGWGGFHLTANAGFRVPNDFSKETAQAHYSLMADYYVCKYFIPFATANAFTVLSDSKQIALGTEGYDLINFGTSNASGKTMAAVGGGFRSKLAKNLDLGFAYEAGVTHPKQLFDERFTVDLILHF